VHFIAVDHTVGLVEPMEVVMARAGREAGMKLPQMAKLLFAIGVIQLLFWLVLQPQIIGTARPNIDSIPGFDFSDAPLAAPNYAAVANADFLPIDSLPAERCCASGYRAFRYQIDLLEVPYRGLGLAPHIRADNFSIYVNGVFAAGEGEMELGAVTYDGLMRKIYHLPAGALKLGRNEIAFVMVREGIPYFDYFPPVLGEYGAIKTAFAKTDFMVGPYQYIVFATILVVAVFALIFFVISKGERQAFWLFGLAAALAALSHYYIWVAPPIRGLERLSYFFVISLIVQYAWFGWADSWSRQRHNWPIICASLVFVISAFGAVLSLYLLPDGTGYDRASEIVFYNGVVFAIATALRLLWNFSDLREDRYWEASIALLLVLLLALQAVTELTHALNMGYVSRTQPFIILGIAIAFFSRKVRLFQSADQINQLLSIQLNERTAELARAHNREKLLVRKNALDEERQRIMRDMHDGLGSHLMSMLMMAKRGKAEHVEYADGLQLVIDEMRLMIDSMDSVGESLRTALAIFKKRVLPRARAAGFEINWTNTAEDTLPDYGARVVLHIFRILQEAMTNALKHSEGSNIHISIQPSNDPCFALRIIVMDNGKGMTSLQQRGRGLTNMRKRAIAFGGKLTVEDGAEGVSVILDLPSPSVEAGS
jgi:two-component system, NarL family, sensor histidine kinase UhpB